MITRDTILNFFKENNEVLKTKFHLVRIGLFGSFARNEQNENSDIDVLIELQDNTQDIFELKRELKKYLKEHFKRNIEICREKYLKSYIKNHILKETIYV